ncbi:tripartite tricarboxylate transporter substrate binding protein [Nocardia puris]|uniref:Putative tricarboxylic transport membrane protein n=1 Tax=Nocardia puris TaxID=208602 RepID=A0A366DXK2_9NOCA|nr:tripartite tricarboxylate transporter substrate-binding protein [Nocardia puris]MBF6210587.1 tripartite tricarboxylate transporter substrate binding protein [Nocardia puris]MBF6369312.1 tripartite tricarboxylate transporter substrate binding protein [Nocardia puris]MBF6457847.1 tripartite tricarboxylate transporter substrate binding protein [Nocardia puris]RBO94014.1 putative tricarboxylic transport membrane protein [Nocardia puris]
MNRRILAVALGVVTVALFASAALDASRAGTVANPRTKLTLVAPAAPGGGWDSFARESQHAMRDNGVVNMVQVVNAPGAAGTIGLSQVVRMHDRHDVMLVTGSVMIGGTILSGSGDTLADTTPIARLADDYNVLVVPADSPFQSLGDFLAAWARDPGGHAIAGGSLGSIDHLLTGLLAQSSNIDPQAVNYLAYAGGGEAVTSLLSHTAVAGISGYNDFRDQIEAGALRALALSAAEPLPDVDIPTFRQAGTDVAMSNWRGLVAPPGIDAETRAELIAIVEEYRDTDEWRDTLRRNNWTDEYMSGDEFEAFLATESDRIRTIIEELGL